MTTVSDRTGCFAWVTEQCQMDLRRVRKIEFDVDMTQCEALWAAPFWMSPLQWVGPQGMSGEVDFVEACAVPNVATNLGCWSAPGSAQCMDGGPWAQATGLMGPKHLVMTLDDTTNVNAGGTLKVNLCGLDGSNCRLVARYQNYLSTVYPTRGQQNGWPFEFRSDVWNGYALDSGWKGCNAQRNPGTQCKYAIRNIKVTSNNGQPVFGGKCAALNAARAWGLETPQGAETAQGLETPQGVETPQGFETAES